MDSDLVEPQERTNAQDVLSHAGVFLVAMDLDLRGGAFDRLRPNGVGWHASNRVPPPNEGFDTPKAYPVLSSVEGSARTGIGATRSSPESSGLSPG